MPTIHGCYVSTIATGLDPSRQDPHVAGNPTTGMYTHQTELSPRAPIPRGHTRETDARRPPVVQSSMLAVSAIHESHWHCGWALSHTLCIMISLPAYMSADAADIYISLRTWKTEDGQIQPGPNNRALSISASTESKGAAVSDINIRHCQQVLWTSSRAARNSIGVGHVCQLVIICRGDIAGREPKCGFLATRLEVRGPPMARRRSW
ncbi:hypothetical protein GY45DRAFT_917479 [Cubamyces sp. BRFM 1775]|nr:hypothetical protein GY45DRAFT_917479 [Cubamyces sp. BRFM 1775]